MLKLKSKFKATTISAFVAALFIVMGWFLFTQNTAVAACNSVPNSGGFGSITSCDGLTITLNPNKAKVGDEITVNYSITDPQTISRYTGVPKTIYLGICDSQAQLPSCTKGSTALVPKDISTNFSGSFTYRIAGPLAGSSSVKSYNLGAYVEMNIVASGEIVTIVGPVASIEVSPSTNTSPDIIITPGVTSVDAGVVKKKFGITYQDGGTGKTVYSYTYVCGWGENGELGAIKDLAITATEFTCSYPMSPAKTYQLNVMATLNDPPARTPVSKTMPVQITGNEQNEGAGSSGNFLTALTGFVGQIINFILGLIQEIIYFIFFYLVAPIIQAMLSIHPYTDSFVAVIYPGWEVVRNLCNILFILALVIIGLGTLFRVESYQYKHLLVQVIVAALLINFSLVIGQIILGLADTIQAQFLPANVNVIRSLAGDLMVKNWREAVYGTETVFTTWSGAFGSIIAPFVYLTLSLGAFMVFLALAGFLLIRIVALWILLLISPIAYACGVLPSMAGYRTQWWQQFLKYAFFTPIIAFFLNMTAIISNTFRETPILQSISVESLQADLGGDTYGYFVIKIASNILLLVFLAAAIKVADSAGIYAASGITSWAKAGTFGVAATGGGMLGNYLQRRKRDATAGWSQENSGFLKKAAFVALNPGAVKEAIKKDSEKNQERAKHFAEAAAVDLKRQIPLFGLKEEGLASELAEAQLHHIDELSKERPYSGNEPLAVQEALKTSILAKTNDKQKANFSRQLLQLTENKGINAFMDQYKGQNGEVFEFTPEGINALMEDLANTGVISKQMAGELRSRMSKLGYDTGQTVLYEGTNYHEGAVHPILFETEVQTIDGKSRRVIKGKNEYNTIVEEANDQLDNIIAKDEDVKKRFADATSPEQVADLRKDLMGDVLKQFVSRKGKYFEGYGGAVNKIDKHTVENYAHWAESMAQKESNINKTQNANDKFTRTHWNSVASQVDGKYELQDAAMIQLENIGDGDFFGLGRGQVQEKTLTTMRQALNDKEYFIKKRMEFKKQQDVKAGVNSAKIAGTDYRTEARRWAIKFEGLTKAKTLNADGAKKWAAEELRKEGIFDETTDGWLEKGSPKPKADAGTTT